MPKQPWTAIKGALIGGSIAAAYTVFQALKDGRTDAPYLFGSLAIGLVMGGLLGVGVGVVQIRNSMVGAK